MAGRGRTGPPSALTPKLLDEICAQLRRGQPKRAAASHAGVHRATLHRWEERGRDARAKIQEGLKVTPAERLYAKFVGELELAWDYGEWYLMDLALKIATGEIKGRATEPVMMLERTRPDEWRRRSSAEYTQREKPSAGRRLDVAKLSASERAALRELLQKARPDDDD